MLDLWSEDNGLTLASKVHVICVVKSACLLSARFFARPGFLIYVNVHARAAGSNPSFGSEGVHILLVAMYHQRTRKDGL